MEELVEAQYRFQCLQLAHNLGLSVDETLAAARRFYEFLHEEDDIYDEKPSYN
jgi:hypothetical protein